MAARAVAPRLKPALGNPINTKLGPAIFTWSITAEESCPGATPACLSCCYARRGFFTMPAVARRLDANLQFSKTADFTEWMQKAVWAHWVRIMRIHVAGDLYDAAYTEKWIRIAEKTPKVRYFLYTRSWRDPEILPAIRRLAKVKNVALWLSTDVDTGRPPSMTNAYGIAWMARNPAEEDLTPPWAMLVFRDKDGTLLKKANGVQVCAAEIGLPPEHQKLTCTRCQLCFRPKNKGTVHGPRGLALARR
jgi:hypothetical protein